MLPSESSEDSFVTAEKYWAVALTPPTTTTMHHVEDPKMSAQRADITRNSI